MDLSHSSPPKPVFKKSTILTFLLLVILNVFFDKNNANEVAEASETCGNYRNKVDKNNNINSNESQQQPSTILMQEQPSSEFFWLALGFIIGGILIPMIQCRTGHLEQENSEYFDDNNINSSSSNDNNNPIVSSNTTNHILRNRTTNNYNYNNNNEGELLDHPQVELYEYFKLTRNPLV